MSGTAWLIIIVVVICTLSAVYYLNTRRRETRPTKLDVLHTAKEADPQTTNHARGTDNGIASKESKGSTDKQVCPPTTEYEGDEAPDIYEPPEARQSARRVTPHYYRDEDGTKSPVCHNYNKRFEDSIVSPFIDELSPASPYLHEAYHLENEGADQNEIDQLLRKADEVDPQTTGTFRLRLSIIKKRKLKEKQRYPKLE